MSITAKIKSFLRQSVVPTLCSDCKQKVRHKFHLGGKIKHHAKKIKHRGKRSAHKLKAGIHHVKIRGKMRKVKVLGNGRWRFMKGK